MPGLMIVWRFALRGSFGRDSAVAPGHDGLPQEPTGRRMERKKQEEKTGQDGRGAEYENNTG